MYEARNGARPDLSSTGSPGWLETLRLDLLRLHAGQVTLDELTADLDRARQVAEDIDAILSGRREVAALPKPETRGSG